MSVYTHVCIFNQYHQIVKLFFIVCKTCLVKYFNDSNNCPTCDIVIHPSYPMGKIIPDRLLEDIIDKILPNLYYSRSYSLLIPPKHEDFNTFR